VAAVDVQEDSPPSIVSRRSPLIGATIRRLGIGVITLVGVSIVIFVATEVLPGDPARSYLGRAATPELLEQTREELGLNQPLHARYRAWLSGVVHGDFGRTLATGVPVREVFRDRVTNSLILAGLATCLLIPLTLLFGTLSALRPNSMLDRLIGVSTLVAISLPEFVVGTLLIYILAIQLDLFPPVSLFGVGQSPLSEPEKLILPVLTLLAGTLGQSVRMMRASMRHVLRAEYVQMAQLKGVPRRRVLVRHVLRNALVPTVQIFAQGLQWFIGGIVVVELVFAYPGIGHALVQAVAVRDYPLIQAAVLVIAVIYIGINIVADLLALFLTPQLRTGDA
jgi:peptide/nickel transport system permease protein